MCFLDLLLAKIKARCCGLTTRERVRAQRKDRWGEVPETQLEGIRADNQAIPFS